EGHSTQSHAGLLFPGATRDEGGPHLWRCGRMSSQSFFVQSSTARGTPGRISPKKAYIMVDRKRPPIVAWITTLLIGLAGFYRVRSCTSAHVDAPVGKRASSSRGGVKGARNQRSHGRRRPLRDSRVRYPEPDGKRRGAR